MKYEILFTDGNMATMEACEQLSIDSLQKLVGGYIEVVTLGNEEILIVNSDAIPLELEKNLALFKMTGLDLYGVVIKTTSNALN